MQANLKTNVSDATQATDKTIGKIDKKPATATSSVLRMSESLRESTTKDSKVAGNYSRLKRSSTKKNVLQNFLPPNNHPQHQQQHSKSRPAYLQPKTPCRPATTACQSDQNVNSSSNFGAYDVPSGFLPPALKNCQLSNVILSARRCLDHLKEVREALSNLVADDEQLSKGARKINPEPHILELSKTAEILTILTREAFVPAHRLNQTTVALYNAEDFLRYPTDIRTFDTVGNGRIRIPDASFNDITMQKLRLVVDRAVDHYNKFEQKGQKSSEMQDILFALMRAYQDLYTLAMGCQEIFKVLLYMTPREKLHLQHYLLSLTSLERSDMLTEVQDLRRLIDELVIFIEKLSWGSFVVCRLASGKNVNIPQSTEEKSLQEATSEKDENGNLRTRPVTNSGSLPIFQSDKEMDMKSSQKEKFTSVKSESHDFRKLVGGDPSPVVEKPTMQDSGNQACMVSISVPLKRIIKKPKSKIGKVKKVDNYDN